MEQHLRIAPYGHFSFGDNGIIIEGNDSFHSLLGCNEGELVGQLVEQIFPVATKIFYQTHLFPLLKLQGHAEEIFLILLAKDGSTVPVLLNAIKRAQATGSVFVCAFIVVRQRKEFEDELVAARKKAEQALQENLELQKLRQELLLRSEELDRQLKRANLQTGELRQLTRVISHEMQEPVRKISVFSQLLIDPPTRRFDEADLIKRLAGSTLQMKQIVAGLQRYLWLHDAPMVYSDIDLREVVVHAHQELCAQFGGAQLELHVSETMPVKGDAFQLQTLVTEIVSNAFKFRCPGKPAKLTIKSTTLKKNSFTSLPDLYRYDDYVRIDFTDEGKGFESEFTSRVLQLFCRLEPNEGRGVGLALCKKVTENHHGFIELRSAPGKGTTVSVLLPKQSPVCGS